MVLTYGKYGNFVDALALGIGLRSQIFVDVLEVGDGHVPLEFLVQNDVVVDELDLARQILQGA